MTVNWSSDQNGWYFLCFSCLLYDGIHFWSRFITTFLYCVVGKWRKLSVGACSHVHHRNCGHITIQLAISMHIRHSLSYRTQTTEKKNSISAFVIDREWNLVYLCLILINLIFSFLQLKCTASILLLHDCKF